ncbi:MAG: glycosyltransferase family 4 protein [Bacteroidales bacterium]|nr:glycosyltransferase family 4 protein [Bacteroidales bacterium]
MRVLHLCNDFAGSTVHAELYRRLDAAGVDQVVYCPIRHPQLDGRNRFESQRTEFIYSPILKPLHRASFHLKIKKIVEDVESKVDLSTIDCVHATTLFSDGAVALRLHRKCGLPYIVAVRNTDINVFMRYMPHLWGEHRQVVREAHKVVFISPNLQRRTLHHRTLKPVVQLLAGKGVVVPNGLNDFWLNNLRLEGENGKNHSVVYVGKFDSNKNVERLVNAVLKLRADIPDIHLDLVGGDGEREVAVLQLVQQNPDTISYLGPIFDKPLLQSIYLKNSVFAMPSKKETFGLVYLEALSQGLRVMYTRGEGIDGLFDVLVGEAVNAFDEGDITDALRRLLLEPNRYQRLMPEHFARFRWDDIAGVYAGMYGEMTGTEM